MDIDNRLVSACFKCKKNDVTVKIYKRHENATCVVKDNYHTELVMSNFESMIYQLLSNETYELVETTRLVQSLDNNKNAYREVAKLDYRGNIIIKEVAR